MNAQSVKYSRLTHEHVPSLVRLLISHRITFLGLSGITFLSYVMEDATSVGNPNVIIATTSTNEIIGWSIAIRNSRNYWWGFLRAHWFYALKILFFRGIEILQSMRTLSPSTDQMSEGLDITWPQKSSFVWGQSHPQVARHVDITVLKPYQGLGVGKGLYAEQIKALRSESVLRIDACIHACNTASQWFHIKDGWALVKIEEGWVYVTKNICEGIP